VDLEKIRGAAERVARSEGLEIVDVEWKVGKQRFLRCTSIGFRSQQRQSAMRRDTWAARMPRVIRTEDQPLRLPARQPAIERDPRCRGPDSWPSRVHAGGEFAGDGPGAEKSRRISNGFEGGWRRFRPASRWAKRSFLRGGWRDLRMGKSAWS